MSSPVRSCSVRNLVKRYKDVVAVAGIDLEVDAGECFGLLGPNGAGKTTTIEICEGLTARDSGDRRSPRACAGSATPGSFVSGSAFSCRRRSSPKS